MAAQHIWQAIADWQQKRAVSVLQTHSKPKADRVFSDSLRKSFVNKNEAQQIANAMASVAPHGALDNTRVDLYGSHLRDLKERIIDNPRLSPWQRENAKFMDTEDLHDKTQLFPDAYHPEADTVWLPSGNPAVLAHELGHGIDINGYPNTTPSMLTAGLYKRLSPTIWKEYAAWNKGRHYFLEGAANHKLPRDLVVRTLKDIERARRTGLSNYWGGALGGLAGLGLGALGTYQLWQNKVPSRWAVTPILTAPALGMSLGTIAGTHIGNRWAEDPYHDSPEAQAQYLNAYAQAYAKKHDVSLADAHAAIDKLVTKSLQAKKVKHKAVKQAQAQAQAQDSAWSLPAMVQAIQGPSLINSEDPGFANSFSGPDRSSALRTAGALLLTGLPAAGLAALYLTKEQPRAPVKKKERAKVSRQPAIKAAAESAPSSPSSPWQSIKAQLPGLHPADTAVGALSGAALGGVYDWLRGNTDKHPKDKRWRTTARRVLTGALLGGAGLNLLGDRARRYISNTLVPFSYNTEQLRDILISPSDLATDLQARLQNYRAGKATLTGYSLDPARAQQPERVDKLTKLWQGAVLDQPAYDANVQRVLANNPGNLVPSSFPQFVAARRELIRRAFGVHANNPAADFFQKNPGGYYSVNEQRPDYALLLRRLYGSSYNKNGPEHVTHAYQNVHKLLQNPAQAFQALNTGAVDAATGKPVAQDKLFDLFGNAQLVGTQQIPFLADKDRVNAHLLDRFDVTPSKAEKAHFLKWLQAKVLGQDSAWLQQPASAEEYDQLSNNNTTNDLRGKSIAARLFWDRILSEEKPWVGQKMTFTRNAPPAPPDASPGYVPWSWQFLREDNTPAGSAITNTGDIQKWVNME
ncbi:hypothetical protein EBZ39_01300 [bacterium]|nr:hypothetical protein [bacterium]